MKAAKIGAVVAGIVLFLLGIVFALQGNGEIGGSSLMDNNSSFIYIGSLVAVASLVVIAFGLRISSKPKTMPEQPQNPTSPENA
jgi:hypothetical protein